LNIYYHKADTQITYLSQYGATTTIKDIIIPDNTLYIYIDNLDGTIADGVVTFDVKVDTTNFVGGEGTPYLDEVRVIINDKDEGYKITECYEDGDYIIFPVGINPTTSVKNAAIRAEVVTKASATDETITYYASSVKKVA
jgi:hypothetical protein